MSSRPRILVVDPLHEAGLSLLRREADVDLMPGLRGADLQAVIGEYQALIVGPNTRVGQQIVEAGYNLRVIGCAGSRLDRIDVTAARTMGIEVRSSPSMSAVAIAEHALTHMLLLAYQAAGRGLAGKTLGIIGFGLVGQQVAQRARAFEMRVVVNQPRLTPELALNAGVTAMDLVELLPEADFVTLHVPFRAETETLIGREELALMKESACLVNTGHTGLVDDAALWEALEAGRLAGAAVPEFPPHLSQPDPAEADEIDPATRAGGLVRRHPRVVVAPHVTSILDDRRQEIAVAVARQVLELVRDRRVSESLSLEVVPVNLVSPHEAIDERRVQRLMESLEESGRLMNPPLVTFWNGRYVILDGATRFSSLQRLGYPYVIVQVVDAQRDDFELHTWYHAIASDLPLSDLLAGLAEIPDLQLVPLSADQKSSALANERALCYFLGIDGDATVALAAGDTDRLPIMREVVDCYTRWGVVERTLLTDLARLRAQIPLLKAVAIFPQFRPETVFEVASRGELLPAGLTRFIIPGRILRLNAELEQLRKDEPLTAKRAWFNRFLSEKLARSRLRYYQEPVILLDE